MVENENNLCHFPDLDNAIIQPSKIKTYLKLIIIFFLDIPSQIEAKFMWRAKEWWKLIYWSTKLTYKFRIEQKSCTHLWNDEIVCCARYPVCLISTIELNKIACLCCFCWCISRSSWQFGATQWWQHQRIPAFTFRFQNGHQVSPFGTNTDISSKRLRIVPPVVAYRVYIHYTKKLFYWLVNC